MAMVVMVMILKRGWQKSSHYEKYALFYKWLSHMVMYGNTPITHPVWYKYKIWHDNEGVVTVMQQ